MSDDLTAAYLKGYSEGKEASERERDRAEYSEAKLRTALIHANKRLADLGARVPDGSSWRTISEVMADISDTLIDLDLGSEDT